MEAGTCRGDLTLETRVATPDETDMSLIEMM